MVLWNGWLEKKSAALTLFCVFEALEIVGTISSTLSSSITESLTCTLTLVKLIFFLSFPSYHDDKQTIYKLLKN